MDGLLDFLKHLANEKSIQGVGRYCTLTPLQQISTVGGGLSLTVIDAGDEIFSRRKCHWDVTEQSCIGLGSHKWGWPAKFYSRAPWKYALRYLLLRISVEKKIYKHEQRLKMSNKTFISFFLKFLTSCWHLNICRHCQKKTWKMTLDSVVHISFCFGLVPLVTIRI